jgi:hypothetical protein
MARASFLCPIDEELCSDPKCSRSYCSQRELEVARERQAAEREARISECMARLGTNRSWATYFVDHPGRFWFRPYDPNTKKSPGS